MSAEAMGWVFRHSPYRGDRLAVHLAIADVVNDLYDHKFWMAVAELSEKSRCSDRTVQRALTAMVADGYLEIVADATHHDPRIYRFLYPSEPGVTNGHPTDEVGVTSGTDRGDIDDIAPLLPKSNPSSLSGPGDFPTAEAVRLRRHPYPDPFEAFWTAYPRNVGKMAAYKAWLARVADAKKQHIDLERRVSAMTTAAEAYAADCDDHRRAEEHIMHAATFLGPTDRWRDYARKPTTAKASDVPSWATGQRAHG